MHYEAHSHIMGRRVKIEIAKASREGTMGANAIPRNSQHKKTNWRLLVTGLPADCSWQVVKDHARDHNLTVIFAGARSVDGASIGVLEFESEDAMRSALTTLQGTKCKGAAISVEIETPERTFASTNPRDLMPPRARSRSRERRPDESAAPPEPRDDRPPPRENADEEDYEGAQARDQ